VDSLQERYVEALVAGDPAAAIRLVDAAAVTRDDVRSMYLEVLQPALYEIGRRWADAEISIVQEHLATATTQSLMARLAERLDGGGSRRGRKALVACAEGEQHALGGRMIADFLDADGWDVLFVGALSPVAAVVALAAEQCVDVVALSASLADRVPEIAEAVRRLRALDPAPVVAVGGQAFLGEPRLAQATGADVYAVDAEMLLRELEVRFP
jgi:MerR family transcriptional regulator, light-induced transcriptional regulator